MSDKENAENYTEIALKNFQSNFFFCKNDFQSSCDFSMSFSATNSHSDYGVLLKVLVQLKVRWASKRSLISKDTLDKQKYLSVLFFQVGHIQDVELIPGKIHKIETVNMKPEIFGKYH